MIDFAKIRETNAKTVFVVPNCLIQEFTTELTLAGKTYRIKDFLDISPENRRKLTEHNKKLDAIYNACPKANGNSLYAIFSNMNTDDMLSCILKMTGKNPDPDYTKRKQARIRESKQSVIEQLNALGIEVTENDIHDPREN